MSQKNKSYHIISKDGIDLVTSGMPCETFSTAGNTSRSFYDDRQFLFRVCYMNFQCKVEES